MANSEPHPLDPDSKLNPEERVVYEALADVLWKMSGDDWEWARATEASTIVTSLHAIGAHVCVGRDCPHDTHRDPLPTEARARSGDPQTSKQAAAAITEADMAERHRAVLQVARSLSEPWTYDEIVYSYTARQRRGEDAFGFLEDLPKMEPQSIRSRCAELRRAGFIVEAGRGMSDAGRPCNLWTVA
jgi:hypothetical protein